MNCEHTNRQEVKYEEWSKYHYDGPSELVCTECGQRIGYFCGNELKGNEREKEFCKGRHPREDLV